MCMTCLRCKGMMVLTYHSESAEAMSGQQAVAWRCLTCGERIDTQILANRKTQVQARSDTKSGKVVRSPKRPR